MAWLEVQEKDGQVSFCNLEEAAFINVFHDKRCIELVDVDGDSRQIGYSQIVGMPGNDQVNFIRYVIGLKPIR